MGEHAKIQMEKKHPGGEEDEKDKNKAIHPSMESHADFLFFVSYLVYFWVIFELALPIELHMDGLSVSHRERFSYLFV